MRCITLKRAITIGILEDKSFHKYEYVLTYYNCDNNSYMKQTLGWFLGLNQASGVHTQLIKGKTPQGCF